jgi:hypothetical protein
MIDSFYTSGNSSLFQIELISLWTSEGRLHNEELNDLYSSPNTILVIKSRRMRLARHVAHMGWGVYMVLVGKPEVKRSLGRPRHRWRVIKLDFQEVG